MPPRKAKPKPKIEEVTQAFGIAHERESEAKKEMEKNKKMFFDLITFSESELATQVIYYTGDDPEGYVASLYPKWRISSKRPQDGPDDGSNTELEWKLVIQEDPEKKTFVYKNPLDGKVYQRTVAESAPQPDLVRLEQEHPDLWKAMTIQPDPPPRELKPLDQLTEAQKELLMNYLLPPKLTNRMEKPRLPKDDE